MNRSIEKVYLERCSGCRWNCPLICLEDERDVKREDSPAFILPDNRVIEGSHK